MFPKFLHSSIIDFILASNWPLNCVPAITAVISSKYTSLLNNLAGTFPSAIFIAKPCAIAVLPTPGSPIKHGLFLERRFKIWIILWISLFLPITASNWPFLALFVRFVPKVSKAFLFLFFLSTLTFFLSLEFEEVSSCCSLLFTSDEPNILENIEPRGIAPKLEAWLSKLSSSFDSSAILESVSGLISAKFIFAVICLNISSNWLVMSFKSFSDKFACFIKVSNGLIPIFLAHS